MKRIISFLFVSVLSIMMLINCTGETKTKTDLKAENSKDEGTNINIQNISFLTITGDSVTLADYENKVVLLVNVASKCGYTPQYAELEGLYRAYKDDGLVVVGFPANNFGKQEPGTNEEIFDFCTTEFDITFPMMAKVSVTGDDKHPLFVFLTGQSTIPGEIEWNFFKFLLDRNGNLVARYESPVEPMSDEIVGQIKKLL